MVSDPEAVSAVRAVLQAFQDGYVKRDLRTLDAFMELFVRDDDLEVIGTGAIDPGVFDWCLGPADARRIVQVDWEGWGDLQLDVAGARIHVLGDVAWLATAANVTQNIPAASAYQDWRERARSRLESAGSSEASLLETLAEAAITINDTRQGDTHVWPLRFTAVLLRRQGRWLFHGMTFSFPTVALPAIRRS